MITPATSIQIPWRISQVRKAFMDPVCAWLAVPGEYFRTWAEVYRG